MSTGISRRQRNVLDFIEARLVEDRYMPSYQDIADGVGYRSKSAVSRAIDALERAGLVRRSPGVRSLEIIEMLPELLDADLSIELTAYSVKTGMDRRSIMTTALQEFFKRRSA